MISYRTFGLYIYLMSTHIGRVLIRVGIKDCPAIIFLGKSFLVQFIQIPPNGLFRDIELLRQLSDMDFLLSIQLIND
ncbi:hypothetical protein D3C78_898320 [compost metagenome]